MPDLDPRKYAKTPRPPTAADGQKWLNSLSRDEALVYRALCEAVGRGGFSLFSFGDAPHVRGTEHPIEFVRAIIHATDDARAGRH